MAARIGGGATFIDLGAGNCAKASKLLPLLDPARYVAVDISADYLHDALRHMQREHPQLDIVGLGLDFSRSPTLPPGVLSDGDRPVFFYPGSSIGNFTPASAVAFLIVPMVGAFFIDVLNAMVIQGSLALPLFGFGR